MLVTSLGRRGPRPSRPPTPCRSRPCSPPGGARSRRGSPARTRSPSGAPAWARRSATA